VALLFENEARRVGVNFILETNVKAVTKESDIFDIESESGKFEGYKKVLICCGSEAYPSLGASADGYEFAKSFSHEVLDCYPSLVQLHVDSPLVQKVSGVKVDAVVTLFVDGLKEKSVSGDLLFTKYGVSGFSILDISQVASLALLYGQKVIISLNLLPKFDRQTLSTYLSNQCKHLKGHTFLTLLSGIISQKIALLIIDEMHLSVDTLCSEIDTKVIKKVANMLQAWRFNVSDTHGFKHAEVSGGGVSTYEINSHTMESKKCKDLYFAGELLDIVGRRGGFNLHFAFASGFIAGKQLAKVS
jgi:predicted Rossmann fold flavoprotein